MWFAGSAPSAKGFVNDDDDDDDDDNDNDDYMITQYPSRLLERAVGEMSKLPGVGRKTALRLVLHLLRKTPQEVNALTDALATLRSEVHYCRCCHNISDTELCEICASPRRDKSLICVVENIQGVMAVESTNQYQGLYHVLGGVISPMDGVGPSDLEIESLIARVAEGGVQEVIFALNPTMEGDTTNFYISRKLRPYEVRMTTLARGVSVGDDLEYTDEVTLGRSLTNRVPL